MMDKCSACPLLWLFSFLALRAVRQDLGMADAIEETTKAQMDVSRFSSPDEKLIKKLLSRVTITTTVPGKPSTNPDSFTANWSNFQYSSEFYVKAKAIPQPPGTILMRGGKIPDGHLGDKSSENREKEITSTGVDYAKLEMNAIGGIVSAVALSMIAACCKAFVDTYKMTGFVTQMYTSLRRMIEKTKAIQPATTETLSSQSTDSESPSLNV